MVSVGIRNQTKIKVDIDLIKHNVVDQVTQFGRENNIYIDVSVAGEKQVAALAMQYMGETSKRAVGHPVLSFLSSEVEAGFVYPPDGFDYVGDIILNADAAVKQAQNEGKQVDEVVCFWARHGARHLMGQHHD